jgi:hypothetical protein
VNSGRRKLVGACWLATVVACILIVACGISPTGSRVEIEIAPGYLADKAEISARTRHISIRLSSDGSVTSYIDKYNSGEVVRAYEVHDLGGGDFGVEYRAAVDLVRPIMKLSRSGTVIEARTYGEESGVLTVLRRQADGDAAEFVLERGTTSLASYRFGSMDTSVRLSGGRAYSIVSRGGLHLAATGPGAPVYEVQRSGRERYVFAVTSASGLPLWRIHVRGVPAAYEPLTAIANMLLVVPSPEEAPALLPFLGGMPKGTN